MFIINKIFIQLKDGNNSAWFDQVKSYLIFTKDMNVWEKEFKYIKFIVLEKREIDVINPLKSAIWIFSFIFFKRKSNWKQKNI